MGGGLRPKDRARMAAGIEPAVAVEAALRVATSVHVGARRVSPTGTPLRPAGAVRASTAARTAAVASLGAAAAGRRALSLRSASGYAPVGRCGRVRKARRSRRPRARPGQARAKSVRAVSSTKKGTPPRTAKALRSAVPGYAPSRRRPLRRWALRQPAPWQLRSLRSLRGACRALPLRLAISVPLLRRCTATASRRSPALALRRA